MIDHPGASKLLITADAGGSNSYRYRLWKAELAALAADTGLTITVCHFPPGTSKWNKIEHRLFSQITMNWRGRPLTSHQVVVATIASTAPAPGCGSPPSWTPAATRSELPFPLTSYADCRSPRTPATAPGTTPSRPPAPTRSARFAPRSALSREPERWPSSPTNG